MDCPYCDKQYKRKGWLADHIFKKHENAVLLAQHMSTMLDHANDQSQQEAMLNIHDNPFWEGVEAPVPTSTPKPAAPTLLLANKESSEKLVVVDNENVMDVLVQLEREEQETTANPVDSPSTLKTNPVPLCSKASQFVRNHRTSLPTTFTQILPTLDWTQELDNSLLQEAIQKTPACRKTVIISPVLLNEAPSGRQLGASSPKIHNSESEGAEDLEVLVQWTGSGLPPTTNTTRAPGTPTAGSEDQVCLSTGATETSLLDSSLSHQPLDLLKP